jgi:carboxyl-terminal processing protease
MRIWRKRLLALVVSGTFAAAAAAPLRAANDVSLLDLIELEYGYTTIVDHYYEPVAMQRLLDGARTGIVAYLRGRGIAQPQVGFLHARADGRGAVPAIEQQVGLAVQRYGARVDVRALVYATIRGELAALHDPYSVMFTKAELAGFSNALNGEAFGGIGIVLAGAADGTWHVDAVFDGSPAAKAGLQQGDVLTAVDGAAVAGLTKDALSAKLRGKIGTIVRVSVERAGVPLAAPFAIVRASVTPPELTARMLPGNVGYVALRTFGGTAGEEVHAALRKLNAAGARAYVFDLRNDGGGYESEAVHVASAFVPAGPIVSMQTNRGKRRVTGAEGTALLGTRPLVVLLNHDSASGSELVAAAIADHGTGTLVGTRSYGKGVVQEMFPLPDGSAMKLTTARYFTPGGRNIDKVGLQPAVLVDEPPDAQLGVPGNDPQLDKARELLTLPATPAAGATNVSPLPNPSTTQSSARAASASPSPAH